jgi:predicted nucleic acid-binding protein
VAVLDADVLVPILSCDLLLSAFDADLYQPVVTATILGEVERNLYADFGHLDPVCCAAGFARSVPVLALHTRADPVVTDAVSAVNPKDRHVAALAVDAEADVVVSNDRRLGRQLGRLEPPVPRSMRTSSPCGCSTRTGTRSRRSSPRSSPNVGAGRSPVTS